MDALAGYGSDSSSSSVQNDKKENDDNDVGIINKDQDKDNKKKNKQTTNSLSSVLGSISAINSDSDSDSDINCDKNGNNQKTRNDNGNSRRLMDQEADNVEAMASKRFKKTGEQQQQRQQGVFPSPILKEKPSIVCWGKDYFKLATTATKGNTTTRTTTTNDKDQSTEEEEETNSSSSSSLLLQQKRIHKLESIANGLQISSKSSSCWAEHLKYQHEFHNPHFFKSVVSYFGIVEPLGSQILSSPASSNNNDTETDDAVQPYEKKLFSPGTSTS